MQLPQGQRATESDAKRIATNGENRGGGQHSAISHVRVNQLREGNLTILERVNSRGRQEAVAWVGQSLLSMIRRSLSSLDAVAVQLLIYCRVKMAGGETTKENTAFLKMVFLSVDKDDDCRITIKQLGKKSQNNVEVHARCPLFILIGQVKFYTIF